MGTVRQRMLKQLFKKVQKILISIEIVHFLFLLCKVLTMANILKIQKKILKIRFFDGAE